MEKVLHQKIKKSENFFPLFILFKNQIFILSQILPVFLSIQIVANGKNAARSANKDIKNRTGN